MFTITSQVCDGCHFFSLQLVYNYRRLHTWIALQSGDSKHVASVCDFVVPAGHNRHPGGRQGRGARAGAEPRGRCSLMPPLLGICEGLGT